MKKKKYITKALFDIRPAKGKAVDWDAVRQTEPLLRFRADSERAPIPPRVVHFSPRSKISWRPGVWRLAAFLLVFVLAVGAFLQTKALEETLASESRAAIAHFEEGAQALLRDDPENARIAFSEASRTFAHIRTKTFSRSFAMAALARVPLASSRVNAAERLLFAGEHGARGAAELARALELWGQTPHNNKLYAGQADPSRLPETLLDSDTAGLVREAVLEAASHFDAAREHLARISEKSVPKKYASQLQALKQTLGQLEGSSQSFQELSRAVLAVLGFDRPTFLLVVLQNSSELRPTGGFLGNVLELTLQNGTIATMRMRDAYDIDGQIAHHTVPPKPIQDISTAWSLHDANWFRDFPTSAAVISGFYEEVEGRTPDGVIAVSSQVLEDVVGTTGPLTLSSGLEIQAGSATDTFNRLGLEQKPGQTLQTGALSELAELLRSRIASLHHDEKKLLLQALLDATARHDISAWFRDPAQENLAGLLGVDGVLKPPPHDFLAVVHANINGFKTDAALREEQILSTRLDEQGELVHTLTLVRAHTAPKFSRDPLYGRVNKDYVRIYVPQGSQLLAASGITHDPYEPPIDYAASGYKVNPRLAATEASSRTHPSGVEIFEESGLTVFGAWLFVSPGEATTAVFEWKPPRRVVAAQDSGALSWTMEILKQPGWIPHFSAEIAASGRRLRWRHPNAQGPLFHGRLERDITLGVLWE